MSADRRPSHRGRTGVLMRHRLTQDKASLQKQLRAAEARCMRLQNQVDDMQHIREEKNEIERAYLAQLEHFARCVARWCGLRDVRGLPRLHASSQHRVCTHGCGQAEER